jgi:hypothetical protein
MSSQKNSFNLLSTQEQETSSPVQPNVALRSKSGWDPKPEVEAVPVTTAQAEETDDTFTTVKSGRRAPKQAVQAVKPVQLDNPRRAAAAGGGFRQIQEKLAHEARLSEQRRQEAQDDPRKQAARARNSVLEALSPEDLDAAIREVAHSLLDHLDEPQIRAMLNRLKWFGPDRKPKGYTPNAFANLQGCDPAQRFRGVPQAYFFQDGRLRSRLSECVAQAWSELVAAVKQSAELKPVHCRVKFNEPAGVVTLDITAFTQDEVKARAAAASAAPGAARESEAAQADEDERAAPAAAGGGC